MKNRHKTLIAIILALTGLCAGAQEEINYRATLEAFAGNGDFAPYFIGARNNGRAVYSNGIWQDGALWRDFTPGRRFSWSYGLEYIAGYGSGAEYSRYNSTTGSFYDHTVRQSPVRLIQLYGQLKYRAVYLTVGMKEHRSRMLPALSSGDLTLSDNARPIAGAAAGFLDFVDIPFTNGWVQIDGEIFYGRMTDDRFERDQFNHYQGISASDLWYTYKRCYFRTKPSQPLSVTVGMQTAGMFAGSSKRYNHGQVIYEQNPGFHVRDLWDMFFPREGSGEGYYKGNSLGSWDFKARIRLNREIELSAYFEWPWEDGSGIGRQNGWDGLWGAALSLGEGKALENIVVEYIDFTNQGGPFHYEPNDSPGVDISGNSNGDNYYNNDFYGPYAYYGMGLGSPVPVSPAYNTDGYPEYAHNRLRGCHLAASGTISPNWHWAAKFSWQRAWADGRVPARKPLDCTSAMIGADWDAAALTRGLSLGARLALDRGALRGNCLGAHITVAYNGMFTLAKNRK